MNIGRKYLIQARAQSSIEYMLAFIAAAIAVLLAAYHLTPGDVKPEYSQGLLGNVTAITVYETGSTLLSGIRDGSAFKENSYNKDTGNFTQD